MQKMFPLLIVCVDVSERGLIFHAVNGMATTLDKEPYAPPLKVLTAKTVL